MSNKLPVIVFLLLICFCPFSFSKTADLPVYSKKETLYSTKSGSSIGKLLLSIEPKNVNTKNNEWVLIIGDNGSKFFESNKEKTLWIFNKKLNASTFKRDMRNRDYPIEVKDLTELMPFCENGIRFDVKEWDELRNQTHVPFYINASPGQIVTLRLVFYIASSDAKRTTIEDEAKVKIEFEIPDPSTLQMQSQSLTQTQTQMQAQQGGGAAGAGGLAAMPEKIDYEEDARIREARREDSIMKAEAANRVQRVALLNAFITERNREVNDLQQEVNALLADKKTKVEGQVIDSIATVADEMVNRVDYWEKGYSDILLSEEGIHDKFSKFRIAHTLTLKKIDELKQQQKPYSMVLDYMKNNMLKSLGIGVGGLVFLVIAISISKKLTSKIKSIISRKISKIKSDAKKKAKEKARKPVKKKKRDDDFEDIDINDLAQI